MHQPERNLVRPEKQPGVLAETLCELLDWVEILKINSGMPPSIKQLFKSPKLNDHSGECNSINTFMNDHL